jgi:hypothetical protein
MGQFTAGSDLFTRYHAVLKFRNQVRGGTPLNPEVVEQFLRSKIPGLGEDEYLHIWRRTMGELGVEVDDKMSYEEIVEASKKLAVEQNANGFKRWGDRPYIEARCIRAMLREGIHILFASQKWGDTGKGPKSYFVERVTVQPDRVFLTREPAPRKFELFIGHPTGPQGPRSTLTYVEYVDEPEVEFDVLIANDFMSEAMWKDLWFWAEETGGLGAMRSQLYGRFDIDVFEKIVAGRRITLKVGQKADKAEAAEKATHAKKEAKPSLAVYAEQSPGVSVRNGRAAGTPDISELVTTS